LLQEKERHELCKSKKNGHKDVQSIENNGYKDGRHEKKKREEEDSSCSLKSISSRDRDKFQGA
jgi:hypothetical protein